MKQIYKYILFLPLLLPLFIACSKESDEPDVAPVERTVIVYMSADNDMWADALADVEEMQVGFSERGVTLVVFLDLAGEPPCLLQVAHGATTTVKTYPEFNSAEASQMRRVLNDVIELYPVGSYGLVLWSHATSWLPANHQLKSFGEDGDRRMNIPELAAALPVRFDFILFDACLMGSVEVAYELKDKTDYLVASTTEAISDGFPYEQIIPELIKPQVDLKAVAQRYFDYYNAQVGADRSATISVVETGHLPELARQLKLLCEGSIVDVQTFDRSAVQRLDVYEEQYTFDLLDFVNKALPEADKSNFVAQLGKAVLYKNHTPQFIQLYDINTYCGLSCYIPHPQRSDLGRFYKTLGWYADSGIQQLMAGLEAAEALTPESRTYVKPVNKTQPRQDNLSEQQTPKGLLPP
jgi:hypothetical protein